ncbi:(2Fe-2S)-binding protein [Pseudanabaena sp. FACHB-2040]|uniref:(2Fe-2S)-binding protein n=1 Tax=Pseudanabaena sp. FACHB-2040 TaxID=2692859 RepID=UPI0016843175|nr:(2Fe-2S)-binding protein [Pseudanabaena sp. FACHB-2040]MBD2261173.1 (2Fe-2S)-binding protein [Pseudanabaena sp. FACHB-2040]
MKIRLRRRRFSQLMIVSAIVTTLGNFAKKTFAQTTPGPQLSSTRTLGPERAAIALNINGREYALNVEPRVSLLDALREELRLTGTKKGCNQGACGACTVLINGQRINSCLTLAVMNVGKSITTIEGLANGDELHPMQAAFIAHDGFQCGYCTSGQIMSAVSLVEEGHADSDAEIREWMSGNLCRCGAYPNIVAAIREVAAGGHHASV